MYRSPKSPTLLFFFFLSSPSLAPLHLSPFPEALVPIGGFPPEDEEEEEEDHRREEEAEKEEEEAGRIGLPLLCEKVCCKLAAIVSPSTSAYILGRGLS